MLSLTKSMKWNICGIKVERHGLMNTNIVKVVKTLCALYARENCIGFMIIFGKDEREKFEAERNNYSQQVQKFMMKLKLIEMVNG